MSTWAGDPRTPGNNKFYNSVTEPVPGSSGVRDVMKFLTFDTGSYNIKDINNYLKDHITGEKITIELDAGSKKSISKLKDNEKVYLGQYRNPKGQLVVCENTFSDLLGFDKVTQTQAVYTTQQIVEVI